MRKDSRERADFCPDCVNGNEIEEPVTVNQYDEDDCCSCCCSCSNTESVEEYTPLTSVNPNEAPGTETALTQKQNLLSNLSIVRTNREQASIQNILQFVEALSHSNNFLRRYYMEEDFCLQCIQDSLCECNLRGLSNLNINDSCTCSACEGRKSDVSEETCATNCSDCPPSKKSSSNRAQNRRNGRRRRRPRNSNDVMQRRRPRENSRQHQNATSEDYDSDCSECQRNRTSHIPSNKILDLQSCDCEECIRQADTPRAVNPNHNSTAFNSANDSRNMSQCSCNSRLDPNPEICNVPNCKDCKMPPSSPSNCNGNSYNSDYCGCRVPQTGDSPCECCTRSERKSEHQDKRKSFDTRHSVQEYAPNYDLKEGTSDCNSCNCEDCQYVTECSDESCEECANPKTGKKQSKKK